VDDICGRGPGSSWKEDYVIIRERLACESSRQGLGLLIVGRGDVSYATED